jgi:hypothetical protein
VACLSRRPFARFYSNDRFLAARPCWDLSTKKTNRSIRMHAHLRSARPDGIRSALRSTKSPFDTGARHLIYERVGLALTKASRRRPRAGPKQPDHLLARSKKRMRRCMQARVFGSRGRPMMVLPFITGGRAHAGVARLCIEFVGI